MESKTQLRLKGRTWRQVCLKYSWMQSKQASVLSIVPQERCRAERLDAQAQHSQIIFRHIGRHIPWPGQAAVSDPLISLLNVCR